MSRTLPPVFMPEPIVQDFEELGCAEDFDEPDRVRNSDQEPQIGVSNIARVWGVHDMTS